MIARIALGHGARVLTAALAAGLALSILAAVGPWNAATMAIDGQALLAAGGKMGFASFVTALPPAPFLLTSAIAWLGGGGWAAAPVTAAQIASALVAGVIAIAWFRSLRAAYGHVPVAVTLTCLLVGNPLFFQALIAGPHGLLPVLGFWMVASGGFELRRNAVAGDAMTVAGGLLLIAFSSPFGLAFAIAAFPFLMLAAPPDLISRSAAGLLLTLLFPVVAAILGFAFVAWIFTGDGWAILKNAFDQSALGPGDSVLASFAFAALGLLACAPIGVALVWRGAHRLQLLMPGVAMMAILLAGLTLARTFGVLPWPMLGLAPALGLAAAAAARWPTSEARRAQIVAVLLGVGVLGAVAVETLLSRAETAPLAAVDGDRALGDFLRGRSGVMMDVEAAPAVVAARRSAEGLIGPADERFALTLLTHRPQSPYLVLSSADRGLPDRLGRGLSTDYENGPANYVLIYDDSGWRVFQRQSTPAG